MVAVCCAFTSLCNCVLHRMLDDRNFLEEELADVVKNLQEEGELSMNGPWQQRVAWWVGDICYGWNAGARSD